MEARAPGDIGFDSDPSAKRDVVLRDLNISLCPRGERTGAQIAAAMEELVGSLPDLVYTAFDGDHFSLTSAMKRYVIDCGLVPASPESIIGYRDAVLVHASKVGVLLDDLAIAGRCDRIWLFTDIEPTPSAVAAQLAEGALLELLWFLRGKGQHSQRRVEFVPIEVLFGGGSKRQPYVHSYLETVNALEGDQRELLTLIDSLADGSKRLREVVAIMHDPLDAKYVHWLRAGTHIHRSQVPLVLQLAIEIGDVYTGNAENRNGQYPMPDALACWLALLRLADKFLELPPVDRRRPLSEASRIVSAAWVKVGNGSGFEVGRWSDFGTPKSTTALRSNWALTDRERSSYG